MCTCHRVHIRAYMHTFNGVRPKYTLESVRSKYTLEAVGVNYTLKYVGSLHAR